MKFINPQLYGRQSGQTLAAGPLRQRPRALFIYEAPNTEGATTIFQNDPCFLGGIVQEHELTARVAPPFNRQIVL